MLWLMSMRAVLLMLWFSCCVVAGSVESSVFTTASLSPFSVRLRLSGASTRHSLPSFGPTATRLAFVPSSLVQQTQHQRRRIEHDDISDEEGSPWCLYAEKKKKKKKKSKSSSSSRTGIIEPPTAAAAAAVPVSTAAVAAAAATEKPRSVELEPEPEGGLELVAFTSMPGAKMKQMEERPDVKSGEGQPVYRFWMKAQVEAKLIDEIRTQILKDASTKANFPGFRKGQVPPFAMPQIMEFSISESIIKTVEAAVDAYGLKSLPGSDGEVNVNEDVKEMSKLYKMGSVLPFTATLNACMDASKQRQVGDKDVVVTTTATGVDEDEEADDDDEDEDDENGGGEESAASSSDDKDNEAVDDVEGNTKST